MRTTNVWEKIMDKFGLQRWMICKVHAMSLHMKTSSVEQTQVFKIRCGRKWVISSSPNTHWFAEFIALKGVQWKHFVSLGKTKVQKMEMEEFGKDVAKQWIDSSHADASMEATWITIFKTVSSNLTLKVPQDGQDCASTLPCIPMDNLRS